MGKPKLNAAELAASLVPVRRGVLPWYREVAPEHQPVLDELAQAWLDGRLGVKLKPAAEGIAATLSQLGVANVKFNAVQRWLEQLPPR